MKTILVAARAEERRLLEETMDGVHRILWCANWREFEEGLTRPVDAVLASAHFDEGRLFDLVNRLRSDRSCGNVPVYGIVVSSRHCSPHFIDGLRSAITILGGQGVLDWAGLRRQYGDAQAAVQLRRALSALLRAEPTPLAAAFRNADRAGLQEEKAAA